MYPELVLMRLENRTATTSNLHADRPSPRSSSTGVSIDALHNYTGVARWNLNNPFHVAVLEPKGILQTYILETTEAGSKAYLYPWSSFQLHISHPILSSPRIRTPTPRNEQQGHKKDHIDAIPGLRFGDYGGPGETDPDLPRPMEEAWGSFDFIPQRPDEIVFFHAGSNEILFAQLPMVPSRSLYSSDGGRPRASPCSSTASKVYCVGRHSSSVFAMAVRQDGLVLASAGIDGLVRVWWILDGSQLAQFKFSGWRQLRCSNSQPPQRPGLNLSRNLETLSREKSVMHFFGKSGDLLMGCPGGEIKFWSANTQKDTRDAPLSMKHSGSIISGSDEISSLASHIPTAGLLPPKKMDQRRGSSNRAGEKSSMKTLSLQELVAVGNNRGSVQVWALHNLFHEWILIWSKCCLEDLPATNARKNEASISCLSFRADGKLLAVVVSNSALFDSDKFNPTSRKERWCCNDFLVLYETSTWDVLQTLNFPSQIGSCLFYRPQFATEKERSSTDASSMREKVASCRLLLVSTSIGPQVHLLPEYGLFGGSEGGKERNKFPDRNGSWAGMPGTNWEKPERTKNAIEDLAEDLKPSAAMDDEGDGTGSCERSHRRKSKRTAAHRSRLDSKLEPCSLSSNKHERDFHGDYCAERMSDKCGVRHPAYTTKRTSSGKTRPELFVKPLEAQESEKRENSKESSRHQLQRSKWDVGLQSLRKVKFLKRDDGSQSHITTSPKSSSPSVHHLPTRDGSNSDPKVDLECRRHHDVERRLQPKLEQQTENHIDEQFQSSKVSSPKFEKKNENCTYEDFQTHKSSSHKFERRNENYTYQKRLQNHKSLSPKFERRNESSTSERLQEYISSSPKFEQRNEKYTYDRLQTPKSSCLNSKLRNESYTSEGIQSFKSSPKSERKNESCTSEGHKSLNSSPESEQRDESYTYESLPHRESSASKCKRKNEKYTYERHRCSKASSPKFEEKNESYTYDRLQNHKSSSPKYKRNNESLTYTSNGDQTYKPSRKSSKTEQRTRGIEDGAKHRCLEVEDERDHEILGHENSSLLEFPARMTEPYVVKVSYDRHATSAKSPRSCDNVDHDIKKHNTEMEESSHHRKEDHFRTNSKRLNQRPVNSQATHLSKDHSANTNKKDGGSHHASGGFGDRVSNSKVTFLNPEKRGGKENRDQTATKGGNKSRRLNNKNKPSKNHLQHPRQALKNPSLGNGNDHTPATPLPRLGSIGGDDLEELLLMTELKLPLIRTMRIGNTFKNKVNVPSTNLNEKDYYQHHKQPARKTATCTATEEQEEDAMEVGDESRAKSSYMLNYPKPFSTASLMQKVHEIQQEQFDVEAAIKVAKKKGISLKKGDVEDLKVAMEEEEEEGEEGGEGQTEKELGGKDKPERPSSRKRYNFPLMKISDPRLAHPGGPPLTAAPSRKAKRHVESTSRSTGRAAAGTGTGEDLRTIQPDLLDLWDLQERCPQVCSYENVDWRTSRSCDDNFDHIEDLAWAQREENWRAISSAQAVYQNCLYGSHFEPRCNLTGRGL